MKGSILDYLDEYGDVGFDEFAFNEVDALLLTKFSYINLEPFVPDSEDKNEITFAELMASPNVELLYNDQISSKQNRMLCAKMLEGKRYSDMRLMAYESLIDTRLETQFCAVTVILPQVGPFILFRGTDITIVGWKEDLNMAYMDEIPGQRLAVGYVNRIAKRFDSHFGIAGHSKGGNLAEYSAMCCEPEIQNRIQIVFNMDGPGFRPDVLENCHFERVENRVIKLLPQSSIVGMLFERSKRYFVVHSQSIGGIAQHDPYSWIVENGSFEYLDELKEGAAAVDETINRCVESLPDDSRRSFVDTMYSVINSCDADTTSAFAQSMIRNLNQVISTATQLDEETRAMLKEIMKQMTILAAENMKQEALVELQKKTEALRRERENIWNNILPISVKKSIMNGWGSKSDNNAERE